MFPLRFNAPWAAADIIGLCAAAAYVGVILWYGRKRAAEKERNFH
mgnify:FL=1